MNNDGKVFSRRRFLKTIGAVGVGSLLPRPAAAGLPEDKIILGRAAHQRVPTRQFGNSGRDVSILSLGGMFDIAANQLMLRQAVQWGVTYWDTAARYQSGSESGIGRYFSRYPEERGSIFVVTKSSSRDPGGIERQLLESLRLMNTTYIDLYFIHGIRRIDEMNDGIRKWAEKAKARGKIRLFGFSTHSNMEACMSAAAKLGWIDGIMMTYNFRNMSSPQMKDAVAACAEAGIGLTAMKTQAGPSWYDWTRSRTETEALSEQFRLKGWTDGQAKLKAVWRNPRIASICSQMDTMRLLKENVDAALDTRELSSEDARVLNRYAHATSDRYCAGCGEICEAALDCKVPISDVMRHHMYCQSYGRPEWARAYLNGLPSHTRRQMAMADYGDAERRCPRNMPIGRLVRQAASDFEGFA